MSLNNEDNNNNNEHRISKTRSLHVKFPISNNAKTY